MKVLEDILSTSLDVIEVISKGEASRRTVARRELTMNDYVEFDGWSLLFAVCWLLNDFRSGNWKGEEDLTRLELIRVLEQWIWGVFVDVGCGCECECGGEGYRRA